MTTVLLLHPRLLALRGGTPADEAARIDDLPVLRAFTRSRTTDAAVVDVPGFGPLVRKRRWWPRSSDRLKGAFRTTLVAPSPARREYDALLRLRALPSGPFAPEPLGVVEQRTRGVLEACTLLVEAIADVRDLAEFLAAERSEELRTAVLADLALRTREMHAAGLVDREHHPRNVLVAGRRTWKVDCWKQRARRRPFGTRDVLTDVAALDVGLVRLATPTERAAFLDAVLATDDGGPPPPALLARLDAERARIDDRESLRLPGAGC